MKLDAGEIKDLVTETERKRANWAAWADEWERLWRLCDYDSSPKDHKEMDGVRSVVMPDPFNIVELSQRMVADEMRVEIPSLSVKEDDEDRSEDIEEWLVAFDFESNRQQGRNHSNDKTWFSSVLGGGASRTIYTGDILPRGLQDRLPILRENLDPRNVGVSRTYYGTEWAYHKYKETRSYVENHYPKFKLPDKHSGLGRSGYWNEMYTIVDFWCWHKGKVWHTVSINDKFALGPNETDYPDIPIIEWYADGAPVKDEMARRISLIHPMRGVYQPKNDFVSTLMTGMEYHFNPLIVAKNLGNQKIEVGPGATIYLNENQSIEAFRAEPNVPMAQALLGILQTSIDQSTFATTAFGDAPGGVTAGFALSNLIQQATARVKIIRGNQEAAYEAENQLILGLVEALAPEEGVRIYGRSSRGDRGKPLVLNKKLIKGNYANRVMLVPEQPMDDNGRIMAWLQMVEKGIVSKSLMRNRVVNLSMPRNEETRIALERALETPEMQVKVNLAALQSSYDQEVWERRIQGTPMQQAHEQEMAWKQQQDAEKEAAKAQRQEEKRQRAMQEAMANMPPMPPGLPMPNGMPGMMPPDIGMPSGLPPDMSIGPEGAGPSPMGMQPPGLPGLPPQAAGQMTPEMMGLGPDAPPGIFQDLTGQAPLSDEEMMRRMGALPPQPQF